MKPQIYLAGPIQDFKDCANWRDQITQEFNHYGIRTLNPLRHKEQLHNFNTSTMPVLNDEIHAKEKIIKRRDRLDIQQSQGVIACFTGVQKASVGTCIEMGWADAYDKPIIVVMDRGIGNPHDHAMLREIAWAIVDDLDEAARLMASFILP
jgi:nucleoside 2-deoxyribosyltransferase